MGRIAVAAIAALWVIPISILFNRVVPEPYMDEIFHIPQAQQYCRGDFKGWDPMITTPPGLYYLSLAYVASLFPGIQCTKSVSSFSDLCSAAVLRSTNGVLAAICGVIIYDILMHLRPALGERRATVYTVVLTMFPLHWFFTFLYYTDVASLTAVLAMYLASLKRHYWFSALVMTAGIKIYLPTFICYSIIHYRMHLKHGSLPFDYLKTSLLLFFHVQIPFIEVLESELPFNSSNLHMMDLTPLPEQQSVHGDRQEEEEDVNMDVIFNELEEELVQDVDDSDYRHSSFNERVSSLEHKMDALHVSQEALALNQKLNMKYMKKHFHFISKSLKHIDP